jgi:hypothetical protein
MHIGQFLAIKFKKIDTFIGWLFQHIDMRQISKILNLKKFDTLCVNEKMKKINNQFDKYWKN